jgi:hypothetical protein
MSLKLSSTYKEYLIKIFNDNEIIINYVVSHNKGAIEFTIITQAINIPTSIEELCSKYKKLNELYLDKSEKLLMLIIIKNSHKHKKHLRIEYVEDILFD